MDASLTKAVEQWLSWNKDEASSNEIKRLVDKKEYSQLEKLLCSRMEFGTAGLRAKMGAGFSQMNTLTIIQTAQGLLKHAQSQFTPEELASKGIVIGFDARYNSKSYASLTASIFARAGCRVRLFSDICPTPYVAFSCCFYGLCLGVMCTASHNPKQDNGYKVYWSNGAQIIPPHDKAIADAIVNNLEPWESSWEIPSIPEIYINELINDPMAEVDVEYMKLLKTSSTRLEKNRKSKLKFTYTPVHGVGTKVNAFFVIRKNKRTLVCKIGDEDVQQRCTIGSDRQLVGREKIRSDDLIPIFNRTPIGRQIGIGSDRHNFFLPIVHPCVQSTRADRSSTPVQARPRVPDSGVSQSRGGKR